MELLYILLVILLLTRGFGEVAERLKQPALIGELICGVVLGVVVAQFDQTFPVLSDLTHNEVFHAVTDLGIFFVMLLAGLELRPKDLVSTGRTAAFVAVGGMALPLALGFLLAWYYIPASSSWMPQALFISVALAITAVPVAVRALADLGQLDRPVGRLIVSAAIVDDILSLVLLSILTAMIRTGGAPDATGLLWLGLKVFTFLAVTALWGRFVMPRLGSLVKRFKSEEFEFSFLLLTGLALAVLAELLAMHFILGAFAAGLLFGRQTIDGETFHDVTAKVTALSSGFLAPIFFASIGLHLDLSSLTAVPVFVLALLAAATVGKVVGSGLPAWLGGATKREALAIGVGMNARGAVELVIADVALRAGLFEQPTPVPETVRHLFSAVVIVATVTTLAAPLLMGPLLSYGSGESPGSDES